MAEFAPGMRVLIRDEEWMIRKCDPIVNLCQRQSVS